MTNYESEVKTIFSNIQKVFNQLSDLTNLKSLLDGNESVVKDKLKDLQFDADSFNFSIETFGKIGFRITERKPFEIVKFQSEYFPVKTNVWIRLNQTAENETNMKLSIEADIPLMLKMMVDSKLKEMVNLMADTISSALNVNN
ncbi:MAG TPA: SRPBCC domain-containing protein [Paludibacteraceae bacterium]|nr:SRPBCC domain-containing protein [Paludibacteraceae bacterium]HOV83688.1 SRPBCC domain-containing protein [Paludibacteraceae bacterium]